MAIALIVLAVGALWLHAYVLLDNPLLARWLPFSNLVVVGNWSPLAAAFLAGLAWRRIPGGIPRKYVLLVPLMGLCLYRAYGPLAGEPPRCGDLWERGVVLQSSPSSCSAAAAATLLSAHGIPATEREMAELCLTRQWGTSNHGLYRGLKLKTGGTKYAVETFSGTAKELLERMDGPVLLLVRLEEGADVDPKYQSQWGWLPGVTHAVVFFKVGVEVDGGTHPGLLDMGDPATGREAWTAKAIDDLWHGVGIRLVVGR